MDGKQKMQADGSGGGRDEGPSGDWGGAKGAGDGGGGAYPNPHTGKDGDQSNFMGHGGQTDIAYHGGDQLGDEKFGDEDDNSATG